MYSFEWDESKERHNIVKHGVSFSDALEAFADPSRMIAPDTLHSTIEERFFCIGRTKDGNILTVRFTVRAESIRIYGAGYWRKGKKAYEKARPLH